MINIAIVDNDMKSLENIRKLLSSQLSDNENILIFVFQNAVDFLNSLTGIRYQILLSDIDMPGMNGIEMAKKVKEMCPDIYIIFLTAYVEYAIESYRMEAYQYILKSDIETRLPKVLEKLLHSVERHRMKYCYIGTNIQRSKVCCDDIIQVSKVKGAKYVRYVTAEGEYTERNSIERVLEMLDNNQFVLAERGCVVNLKHVMKIRDNTIYLSNRETVEVSYARVKMVKERLYRYWEEE